MGLSLRNAIYLQNKNTHDNICCEICFNLKCISNLATKKEKLIRQLICLPRFCTERVFGDIKISRRDMMTNILRHCNSRNCTRVTYRTLQISMGGLILERLQKHQILRKAAHICSTHRAIGKYIINSKYDLVITLS